MIFITVGTTKFEALVKEIDAIAPTIKEKIIIQKGNCNYKPKNCEYFDYDTNLKKYFSKARIIITHGGAGTLFELLKMQKKIIGVENKDTIDSHQKELLKKLSDEKYIMWCKDISKLKQALKESEKFKFEKYVKPQCEIDKKIVEELK